MTNLFEATGNISGVVTKIEVNFIGDASVHFDFKGGGMISFTPTREDAVDFCGKMWLDRNWTGIAAVHEGHGDIVTFRPRN